MAPSAQGTIPAESAELENTYWKLTHLGNSPLTWKSSHQREPHLIFNSAIRRVGGSGGCNSFGGSYRLSGERLSLDSVTTTLMACAEGMETEQAFLDALGQVNGWKVTGQQLDLLDGSGKTIAQFEAVKVGGRTREK
jgi:heat shock protein HslJ